MCSPVVSTMSMKRFCNTKMVMIIVGNTCLLNNLTGAADKDHNFTTRNCLGTLAFPTFC